MSPRRGAPASVGAISGAAQQRECKNVQDAHFAMASAFESLYDDCSEGLHWTLWGRDCGQTQFLCCRVGPVPRQVSQSSLATDSRSSHADWQVRVRSRLQIVELVQFKLLTRNLRSVNPEMLDCEIVQLNGQWSSHKNLAPQSETKPVLFI